MAQSYAFKTNTCIEWKTKLVSLFPPPERNSYVSYGFGAKPSPRFKFNETDQFGLSQPRTSPSFELLGSVWHLEIFKMTGNPTQSTGTVISDSVGKVYTMSLIAKCSEDDALQLETPFSVGTCIRHPTDASRAPLCWQWHDITDKTQVDVWSLSSSDIVKELDWIQQLDEVRFLCIFYSAGTKIEYVWPETKEKSVQVSSLVPRNMESLSSDFSSLLKDEVLTDVRLECGCRIFQAHRSVLAARSDVFRAMFQNETLESKTGTIKIQDMEIGVLEKLLTFLYTGKPEDISDENAADLYEASDKYSIISLKTACAYWIQRNLTAENCIKYLKIADSHSDKDLKEAVISFILKNPSVLKSEDWAQFSKELALLAIDVLHAYVASTVQ